MRRSLPVVVTMVTAVMLGLMHALHPQQAGPLHALHPQRTRGSQRPTTSPLRARCVPGHGQPRAIDRFDRLYLSACAGAAIRQTVSPADRSLRGVDRQTVPPTPSGGAIPETGGWALYYVVSHHTNLLSQNCTEVFSC